MYVTKSHRSGAICAELSALPGHIGRGRQANGMRPKAHSPKRTALKKTQKKLARPSLFCRYYHHERARVQRPDYPPLIPPTPGPRGPGTLPWASFVAHVGRNRLGWPPIGRGTRVHRSTTAHDTIQDDFCAPSPRVALQDQPDRLPDHAAGPSRRNALLRPAALPVPRAIHRGRGVPLQEMFSECSKRLDRSRLWRAISAQRRFWAIRAENATFGEHVAFQGQKRGAKHRNSARSPRAAPRADRRIVGTIRPAQVRRQSPTCP